jgi:hypothetical protein
MPEETELTGQDFVDAENAKKAALIKDTSANAPEEEKPKAPIQLYIIKTKISNENYVENSKDVNDKQKLFTYKFAKDTRDRIKAIRMKHKSPIYNGTLDFYGLRVCSDAAKPIIQKAIDAAETDFKTLRSEYITKLIAEAPGKGEVFSIQTAESLVPHLGASVMFIPLDFQQIFKGNLYSQITDAIQYQVYSGLFQKMENMLKRTAEGKELPERSRNALIKTCETLKSINVTQDENINKRLEGYKTQITKGELAEVAASLKQELDTGKSRWAAIEL